MNNVAAPFAQHEAKQLPYEQTRKGKLLLASKPEDESIRIKGVEEETRKASHLQAARKATSTETRVQ